ncbi:MAG: alpha/beta family hydrolase [Thermoanaerobaculia bacterium]|nr:alpha/beta family hydrolase [Thermoanaerobaculia bacterium]
MTRPESLTLEGPAGRLEAALTVPGSPRHVAVVSHPHPLYGGSMDNLVVREVEHALLAADTAVLRYNFRGVGGSEGGHDRGEGEKLDLATAIATATRRYVDLPLLLAGYSFGAIVTLALLAETEPPPARLAGVLALAPPVSYFKGDNWSTADRPAAIVYGSADELTPEPRVRELAVNLGTVVTREKLDGAGHDLGTFSDPAPLREALRRSIAALLAAPVGTS